MKFRIAWEKLTLAVKQSLALGMLREGNAEDHALVAFYALATRDAALATTHLGKAGQAGATVRVRLTVVVPDQRYYVAIVDPLPAGLEGVNLKFKTSAVSRLGNQLKQRVYDFYSWYSLLAFDHREMRDESVPRRELDHAATADPAPHASRDLPGLEQLLAGEIVGLADRTGHAGEERLAREPAEVSVGEPRAAPGVEAHGVTPWLGDLHHS